MGQVSRGRILGRNWDKSLISFPPCYLQSVTSTNGFYSPPPLSNSGLKRVCHVNIVYGNLKSENSQDYAQKSQRNCTFMNSASRRLSFTISQQLEQKGEKGGGAKKTFKVKKANKRKCVRH
jgi:hypothetical protein